MRHHRQSVRLRAFDYTGGFVCMVTICTEDRCPVLGRASAEGIVFSDTGRAADDCWNCVPAHFPNVTLDAYTIQPNHVHGIITLAAGARSRVGAQSTVGAQYIVPLPMYVPVPLSVTVPLRIPRPPYQPRFGHIVAGSLPSIIRTYKAAVTRLVRPATPIWQRGYHETILRNPVQIARARRYIASHPAPVQ
jgi:REP element-mobilizing transposase RayT